MKNSKYTIHKAKNIVFRLYGKGSAIVLLHSSPNNAAMMHPFASILANHFTVICPDTPGYGLTPDLAMPSPTMTDYAEAFDQFFDSIGLTNMQIYGSATGAQIAIRYGIQYPHKVQQLYLDNCAHFTDEEREAILQHYFPNLSPTEDGTHFTTIWEIASNLFNYFPWCFQTPEYKLNTPAIPKEIIHKVALDYIIAGENYFKAYKAAFEHEKIDYILKLTVPTTIFRWQGSILSSYTDRIFENKLPSQIMEKSIPAPNPERFAAMTKYILDTTKEGNRFEKPMHLTGFKVQKMIQLSESIEVPEIKEDGSHLTTLWKTILSQHSLDDYSLVAKQQLLADLYS